MCLAIPAKVTAIDGMLATVDMMGNEKVVGIDLVPEVRIGDYVLVHAGFAIEVLDEEVAKETEELFWEGANAINERE